MITLARVALVRLVRDRSNVFFVVLFPLLLVMLIGLSFGGQEERPRVVLAATGEGDLADQLAEALEGEGLDVSRGGADAARQQVAEELVDAGLLVPSLDPSGTVTVRLLVVDADAGVTLRPRVAAALGRLTATERAQRALDLLGLTDTQPPPAPGLELTTTFVDDTADSELAELAGLGPFDLGASSQLLLFVFITALTNAATVVQTRRWGIVERVLAGPTSSGQLIAGLGLGQLAVGLTQAAVIVVVTASLFDVSWGNPVATGAVVLVFALVAAAASLLLGALLDNEEQVGGIAVPVALVLAALGGSMLPLELFPDGLRTVAFVTPHAWANTAFAEIVRRDGGVLDVLPQLAALTTFALVLGGLATAVLRRRVAG